MNDRRARTRTSLKYRLHVLALIGVFMFAGAAVIVPFYSTSASSAGGIGKALPNAPSAGRSSSSMALASTGVAARSATSFLLDPIATFDTDCTTPKTDFTLGDTVCVKASGIPFTLFPWHIIWVDPAGLIRQADVASPNDNTTYTFTLPTDPTTEVNGRTIDNSGTWRASVARSNGSIRSTAPFVVHETGNPQADVAVKKVQRDSEDTIHVGENAAFVIVVLNAGPDSAAGVHLVDSLPAGATLVSFNQDLGPACTPSAPGDCTIASLANGERAEFTAIYTIGGSPGDSQTSASVSSTTPDPNTDNNSSTVGFVVASGTAGGGGCELTCPSDVAAFADTTEGGQRGAHVNFDPAVGAGTCGTITATPASGSFFPVGQTVVNVTSETGDGGCQFTVTVDEQSGNVSIICPGSLTGNANGSCEASFNLGNPTTAGDNVTVTVSRSDGKPMYDCDSNGQNCVRKTTDLPFAAGVTTVTWIAYSHSTPGPYATPDDEEAARTGSQSCTQTVTVNDVTPPVIGATNQTVSADANCQAVVPDYSSTVTDNCACDSSDTAEACLGHPHVVVTQDPAPGTVVGLGDTTVHITANDGSSNNGGAGNTSTKDITLTVADTTPPTFTFVPADITAYTGPGATTCDTVVDPGVATAVDNCGPVTVTRSPSGNTFPVGTTTVTWTATDGAGNHTSATQTITVIDNTVPVITLNGNTPSMWPPNHKYQTFTVTNFVSSVFDNCGGVSVSDVVISQVTSDETENGNGDGNTTNDIVIASDCKSVQLRAERDGGGDGRVYTITFRLRDTHGNTTTATARVVVAHNPGETPIDSGVHYTVNGGCP